MQAVRIQAVLFDLGGVVLGSPLHAIARHERESGIPAGFVNRLVVATGPQGAWSRLERGELAMEAFYDAFERECIEAGARVDARAMMERVHVESQPRPAMLAALGRLRAAGLRTAAVTNNWVPEAERGGNGSALRPHFDAFVESCVVGVRKPDARIYHIACEALGVAPAHAAFLDDIGANLKTARGLGMATIKVEEPDRALAELETLVGFALREASG
jgi:putative hydrolase of the HAD superfamily